MNLSKDEEKRLKIFWVKNITGNEYEDFNQICSFLASELANAKKEVVESLRMEKKTELEGFDTNQKEEFRRLGYNQAVQELNTKIDDIINQSEEANEQE